MVIPLRAAAAWLALTLLILSLPARASLTVDLAAAAAELETLNGHLASVNIGDDGSCSELGTLNTSIEDYIDSIEALSAGLTAPLILGADDMSSLDALSTQARAMADETVRLSFELRSIEDVQDFVEYPSGLSAMLRLADDIGTMADRILEMADRILTMADNIGTMADRILITQTLQNSNIALSQAALLTTLNNLVALSESFASIGYNLSLGLLSDETGALAGDMGSVVLSEANMAAELKTIETMTAGVLGRAVDLYTAAMLESQKASHYINGDTLTLLGDLSGDHQGLAAALEAYAGAIERLAPITDNAVLRDATASMLQLVRDIGLMSDRILQMSDRIIVMADNIGAMAGRITETQNIQQSNVLLTQSSLLAAQNAVIATIRDAGL